MKAELTKLEGLTRKLNVEVPLETVTSALEQNYKAVQKVAQFKGFRQGKAPMDMVRAQYKGQVESDVVNRLIQDHYGKALDEHSLIPVSLPEIDFENFREGEPLKFSATFEIRPEVVLPVYKGLDLEKEKPVVAEAQVDQILENIQKSRVTYSPMLEIRAAQKGDVAVIDFAGTVEGKEIQGGSGQDQKLEIGADQFIPGFEDGIVGMNPGDTRTINLTFPTDYNATELAGKPASFLVTLKAIQRKVVPELNDEFAKTLGGFENLEALKADIRKDLMAREEKRVQDDLKEQLLQKLVKATNFDVPKSMVAHQKETLIEDLHHKLEQQGMGHADFEEYKKKWDADFEKSAQFVVRASLLISTIAQKESLAASDADVDKKVEEYAANTGIELAKIRAMYKEADARSRLRATITEENVIKFLFAESKIKEVEKKATK